MPDPPLSDASPSPPDPPAATRPGQAEELPSLLSLFERPAAPVASVPQPTALPPPLPPPPISPPPAAPSAAEVAARQQAEQLVAQLRRQAAGPPAPPPAPTPPPATVPATRLVVPPTPPPPPTSAAAPPYQAAPRRSNGLLIGLLVVGVAVLAVLSYLALRRAAVEAQLATTVPVDTMQAVAAPPLEATPAPAPVVVRETVRVAVPTPVAPIAPDSLREKASQAPARPPADTVAAATPTVTTATPDSGPVPAAPEAGDDAATRLVREKLAAYYADLYEPPLHAAAHFAPRVERLYIQRNLTPEQIDAELARSFFPDNRHAAYQVEPGTLRVTVTADGSLSATYIEAVRLFRVSQGQHQRLRTQVRVRFNAEGQLVFMRQEKLLTNVFEP